MVVIGGKRFFLWRAVDDEGEVLDLLVQRRRDKTAAVTFLRKLLKKQGYAPDVIVTDKLRSYGAAKAQIGLSARHERACADRAELAPAHPAAGAKMQRFKFAGTASVPAAHAAVCNTFNLQRHLISRRTLRLFRANAMKQWQEQPRPCETVRQAAPVWPKAASRDNARRLPRIGRPPEIARTLPFGFRFSRRLRRSSIDRARQSTHMRWPDPRGRDHARGTLQRVPGEDREIQRSSHSWGLGAGAFGPTSGPPE